MILLFLLLPTVQFGDMLVYLKVCYGTCTSKVQACFLRFP
jgi:hypothetical protein